MSVVKAQDAAARKEFSKLPKTRSQTFFSAKCVNGETRYPFTIRLPTMMYYRLRAKADSEKRSVAAQVELDLAEIYK